MCYSLVSQQQSFSEIICGTVAEVHGNTSDTTATKDNLKVTARCDIDGEISGENKPLNIMT